MGIFDPKIGLAVLGLVRQLEPHATFITLDSEFEKIVGSGEDVARYIWLMTVLACLENDGLIWSEKVGRSWSSKKLYFYTSNGKFQRKPKEKAAWKWVRLQPFPQAT